MRSLPPSEIDRLPRLDRPAGYILVTRDIDRDAICINRAQSPSQYVAELLQETESEFGLELVSVLECEDLAQSEAELFQAHHARLSADWHAFDALQIEALRSSRLQIDAHESLYLMPGAARPTPAPARPVDRSPSPSPSPIVRSQQRHVDAYIRGGLRQGAGRRERTRTPIYKAYGEGALRGRERGANRAEASERRDWWQRMGERFENWMVHSPGAVILVILIVILVLLVFLSGQEAHYWNMPR